MLESTGLEILYLIVPLSLVLVGLIVGAFLWAVRSGQFEDLEGPAHRILLDDDEPAPRADADGLRRGRAEDDTAPQHRAFTPAWRYRSIERALDLAPSATSSGVAMAAIMDQLKIDHANVAHLLALLEAQIDSVEREGDTDFELMHDIMLYMTRYPDRFHHPMEDLVFQRMCVRDTTSVEIVDRLEREHVSLKEKGAQLLDLLARVVDGALVERDELSAKGRDYALFLRSHMRVEDTEAFPRAERVLEPEDWARVEAGMEARTDPVFGPVLDEDFRALFEYIERSRA